MENGERPSVLGVCFSSAESMLAAVKVARAAQEKREAQVQLEHQMDCDRLIRRGESTSAEWLKECLEMEKESDAPPQEQIEGSAALTGWPYSVPDPVNNPKHYKFGRYEVIDVCEDWFPDEPHLFQVCQYIARAKRKGNFVQDLEKAIWYLRRRISIEASA